MVISKLQCTQTNIPKIYFHATTCFFSLQSCSECFTRFTHETNFTSRLQSATCLPQYVNNYATCFFLFDFSSNFKSKLSIPQPITRYFLVFLTRYFRQHRPTRDRPSTCHLSIFIWFEFIFLRVRIACQLISCHISASDVSFSQRLFKFSIRISSGQNYGPQHSHYFVLYDSYLSSRHL